MKKISAALIALMFIALLPINSFAQNLILTYDGAVHNYSGKTYGIKVNGEIVSTDIPSVIINDRSLVPARAIFEKLGAAVVWNSSTQKVSVALDGKIIELAINNENAVVNNKTVKLDVPAKIINDRTMVPIRFVGEELGMKVGWFPAQSLITLDKSSSGAPVNLNSISYSTNNSQCEVLINVSSYEGYKVMKLSSPDRIVIDIPNVITKPKQQTINVSSNSVKAIRYVQLAAATAKQANYTADTARVVLDMSGQFSYNISEKSGTLAINVPNNGNLTTNTPVAISRGDLDRSETQKNNTAAVSYTSASDHDDIIVSVDDYKNYSVLQLGDQNQIVLDIPNAVVSDQQKDVIVNSSLVHAVSCTQTEKNSAELTIDLIRLAKYNVIEEKGRLILRITSDSYKEKLQDIVPSSTTNNQTSGSNTAPSDVLNIQHSKIGEFDDISIELSSYKGYKAWAIKEPNRIIIDIPYTGAPRTQQKIDINSKFTKSVRYAQTTDALLRVVADVKGQPDFEVLEKDGKLVLRVKSCLFKNLDYQNTGDRVVLVLSGAKLTSGGEKLVKNYTEKYDTTGKKYTITFNNNLADLDNELIKINDNLLETIEVISGSLQTSIVFNAKDRFIYNVFTRAETDDTAVTVLKPSLNPERLVIIDSGHGGVEPGAIASNLYEKDLNIDIALRLNKLLKGKNIKTYMIRDADSYVALFERAYIANNLNASLFLSIHNNAYYASSKGTETLYYTPKPNAPGFSSKSFAQIIQNSLLSALGTYDRKIVSRPNLVVLKGTVMPAALAEIAFMTNSEDKAKLQTEAFRQKAAEALCNSIIKALNELK